MAKSKSPPIVPVSTVPPPAKGVSIPEASAADTSPPRLFRPVDWLTLGVVSLVMLLAYLLTLAPDLTLEDSGELAVGSMYAGVPHPPGYPLWTLYSWAFTKLLPFSNMAWRVAVSSAVAAALASGLIGMLVSRGSSLIVEGIEQFKDIERRWENPLCLVSGLVAGLLLGFNGFIWSQAVIVEVYTLAVLTLAGVLVCLFRWTYAPHQRRYLYFAFFLFGLCFCNHQTLIVAAIGLEVTVLMADRRLGRDLFFANALIYALVMFGRTWGLTTILADNPGVFSIFNLVGLGSLIVALAYTGVVDGKVRLWTLVGVGVVGFALFNLLTSGQSSLAAVKANTTLSMQAVAEAAAAAEGQISLAIKLLTGFSLLGLVAAFVVSYSTERKGRLLSEWAPVLISGLVFGLGAAVYFYMPIASMTNPPMNWGYPRTWEGFIHAFTRGQYEKTNPTSDPFLLLQQMSMYAEGAKEEFNWANLLIGLVPFLFIKQMQKRERGWLIGLSAIYLTLAFLLMILLNPSVDRQSRELVKVFFTSSHIVIAMGVGFGLSLIGAIILTQYRQYRYWLLIGAAVACAFNLYEVLATFRETVFPILRGATLLSLAISFGFLVLVILQRERALFAPFLALFALIPFDSALSHWGDNEQRNHYFGFWFGHDMFEPGADTSAAPAPKDKSGKPLYPPMTTNSVLFGGTDPGRFAPTYMVFAESFTPAEHRRNPNFDRRDVYVITQNALADNTYLDYIRAHYNRSAEVDLPFFYGMLNDAKSALRGRTNTAAQLAAPLDRFLTDLGARIEKRRRAGSSMFTPASFTDFKAFQSKLQAAADPVSKFLKEKLGSAIDADAKTLARALNRLMEGPAFYTGADAGGPTGQANPFAAVPMSQHLQRFAKQDPPTANRIRLNRLLLEAAYPELIVKSQAGLYPDLEIITPSPKDAARCFQEYTEDAARRYQLNQLDAGEIVNVLPDGRVSVTGQVAVMAINGLLTKVIFDANPDHEFYVEESFALKWMYPHLVPGGIIMKIERQPVKELSEEVIQRDHEYWSQYSARLIGDWIKYDTTVKEVTEFAKRTYRTRDLVGFKGDPKFVRDRNAQKAFSKLRNAIGKSIYTWRAQNASHSPEEQQRYLREAEFALKQAFAFCPYSPETVFNYASLLASMGRYEDAATVARTCYEFDPDNYGVRQLLQQLEQLKATSPVAALNPQGMGEIEDKFRAAPTNVDIGFQLASAYFQANRSNDAMAVLESFLTNPGSDIRILVSLAEAYRQVGNVEKMERALERFAQQSPESPEAWFDLAAIQAAQAKTDAARTSLTTSLKLSDARLAKDPKARNLRELYSSDSRFDPVRGTLKVP
ncbi:MAG TPA: DUF2723 domain-containing protein [Verrucomicrobiota bacterium]|nr:DUF2723 domain-containing protein [Verrucomicrobiales bacterium]HRI11895.1 DUF2723 domain-containing protein [Verrucomicrobiota bacterium]